MMDGCREALRACSAAHKLRTWFAAGAVEKLTLTREDFPEERFALIDLLTSGTWQERTRQQWRSLCAWIGRYTPFTNWKIFWYRLAGARIGENVRISPGAMIDFLFPQLVTLEDGAVLRQGALVVGHVYTPDRIVLGQAIVKKRAVIREQGILAVAEMGEEAVLEIYSYTVKHIPAGHIGTGVPAVIGHASQENEHD